MRWAISRILLAILFFLGCGAYAVSDDPPPSWNLNQNFQFPHQQTNSLSALRDKLDSLPENEVENWLKQARRAQIGRDPFLTQLFTAGSPKDLVPGVVKLAQLHHALRQRKISSARHKFIMSSLVALDGPIFSDMKSAVEEARLRVVSALQSADPQFIDSRSWEYAGALGAVVVLARGLAFAEDEVDRKIIEAEYFSCMTEWMQSTLGFFGFRPNPDVQTSRALQTGFEVIRRALGPDGEERLNADFRRALEYFKDHPQNPYAGEFGRQSLKAYRVQRAITLIPALIGGSMAALLVSSHSPENTALNFTVMNAIAVGIFMFEFQVRNHYSLLRARNAARSCNSLLKSLRL